MKVERRPLTRKELRGITSKKGAATRRVGAPNNGTDNTSRNAHSGGRVLVAWDRLGMVELVGD